MILEFFVDIIKEFKKHPNSQKTSVFCPFFDVVGFTRLENAVPSLSMSLSQHRKQCSSSKPPASFFIIVVAHYCGLNLRAGSDDTSTVQPHE